MRIRVETDHRGVGNEFSNRFLRTAHLENFVIDARKKILMETADGFRGAENGATDSGFIEPDQRAIPFLNLYNAILNSPRGILARSPVTGTKKGPSY